MSASPVRLGILATHPIQYFAPLWRALARAPGLELTVYFQSDISVRGGIDPGFGVPVSWDVPLLDGYTHRFLRRDADLSRPMSVGLADPEGLIAQDRLDAVLVHGYTHRFEAQIVEAARRLGRWTLARGEFTTTPRPEPSSLLKQAARAVYLKWFLSQIDGFCYLGERSRQYLLEAGVGPQQLFSSPYSVDVDLLESQRARFPRTASRQELAIPPDALVLLFSGKLIPRKDPLLLFDALDRLEAHRSLWLVVVGDGELRPQVEQRGRALLGERLILPGFVNQSRIGKYFAAADLFVFPSQFETWGLVVNEAMQFGLPVLCTDQVGASSDLVVPGETGLLFPAGDAAGLAAAIHRAVDAPGLRDRMAGNARTRVQGFTPQASAQGIIDALGWLATPGGAARHS